jgi:hypothetical protein
MFARGCVLAAASALVVIACGGGTDQPGPADGSTNPLGGDSGVPAYDSGMPPPPGDGGKVTKPKALGSPCTMDAECETGLMCNTSIAGGLCTKSCTMNGECTAKGGAVGACVQSICFAPCDVAADGGSIVDDAGKTKAACKNKALVCTAVAGATAPICLPNPDAGAGDDGGPGDATAAEAAPGPDATTD